MDSPSNSWIRLKYRMTDFWAAPAPISKCSPARRNKDGTAGVIRLLSLQPPLRKLDQPVALAAADFIDDAIGNTRRADAVHDQRTHANASSRGVPLKLDGDEAVARKQRWPHFHLAALPNPLLA
jgi:hypothetical protein